MPGFVYTKFSGSFGCSSSNQGTKEGSLLLLDHGWISHLLHLVPCHLFY
ncbi:hypothetical protein C368_06740 [Cryptococcus neoformans 125.91]|nr:hypothetical protein C368_06740 [Cryptococcus neoformans var. grubii 125.91]